MHKNTVIALVFFSLFLVACKGGGSSSGSSSGGGTGSFNIASVSNLGNTCIGYTMSQSKCEAISGTWNSSAVPESGECSVSISQNNGICKVGSKKFTAVAGYSQSAIDTCEHFGGIVTPTTLGNCNTALGTWTVVAPATTSYSCSIVPSGQTDCDAVGGIYGSMRKINGGAAPTIGDLPIGVNTLNTNLSVPTGHGFSVGTRIVDISGTLSLWSIYNGPSVEYWSRSFSISKNSDFFSNTYDATLDFTVNYQEAHSYDEYQDGVYMKLNVTFLEDI